MSIEIKELKSESIEKKIEQFKKYIDYLIQKLNEVTAIYKKYEYK